MHNIKAVLQGLSVDTPTTCLCAVFVPKHRQQHWSVCMTPHMEDLKLHNCGNAGMHASTRTGPRLFGIVTEDLHQQMTTFI